MATGQAPRPELPNSRGGDQDRQQEERSDRIGHRVREAARRDQRRQRHGADQEEFVLRRPCPDGLAAGGLGGEASERQHARDEREGRDLPVAIGGLGDFAERLREQEDVGERDQQPDRGDQQRRAPAAARGEAVPERAQPEADEESRQAEGAHGPRVRSRRAVGDAKEQLLERGLGRGGVAGAQLVGRAHGLQGAVADDGDPVAEPLRGVEQVGRQEDGPSARRPARRWSPASGGRRPDRARWSARRG